MTTPDLTILQGDCREKLRELPAVSVHCAVTSPPYYSLRDYKCAGQIGLEATPDEFVAQMVEVFREVKRVLRDDGTLWLNLGDSYAGGAGGRGDSGNLIDGKPVTYKHNGNRIKRQPVNGLKPKDLIGIPWMVAFALRADGWYLRQDLIWAKPNPMPESVTDRCTKAHEYLFLLSKSERYFYDADAIKEPMSRGDCGSSYIAGKTAHHQLDRASQKPRIQRKPAGWDTGAGGHDSFHRNGRAEVVEYTEEVETMRNKRSVWTVPTFGFPEAHFATYPPALIKPCILAGCPPGGVVLDLFAGSGTTGKVALELGRSAILIELNPDYVKLIERRCRVNLPLMFEVT